MLLVFDTHPVQYRAPVYQELARRKPGSVFVGYASDCSLKGYRDAQFGRSISWDEPLLAGYPSAVMGCERGTPLAGWSSLSGAGVRDLVCSKGPRAVLCTGLNYRFDWSAAFSARKYGAGLWLRCETQDRAFVRPVWKTMARKLFYTRAYRLFDKIFYIGELNKEHYVTHGVPQQKLIPARYATVNRCAGMSEDALARLRESARGGAGASAETFVVGFSGKLIPKKNPDLLFAMLEHIPPALRRKTVLYFMGSGELESDLRRRAVDAQAAHGVKSHFCGFVNQSKLAGHYLAMDVLVLPSRRQGETWGLVANEAMQAGCGLALSDAVGCAADFGGWERVRVFPEGDASGLAEAIASLSNYTRSLDWASSVLCKDYSVESTASALLAELETCSKR